VKGVQKIFARVGYGFASGLIKQPRNLKTHNRVSCGTLYASRHACSRTDATLFWTRIKIAKALKELNEEE
jgi:hypothetical protein